MDGYDSTITEVAEALGVSSAQIRNWAKLGYPTHKGSIPLEGAMLIGKRWKFNLCIIKNFIREQTEKQWVHLNVKSNKEMVRPRLQKTGQLSSMSMASDIAERFQALKNLH